MKDSGGSGGCSDSDGAALIVVRRLSNLASGRGDSITRENGDAIGFLACFFAGWSGGSGGWSISGGELLTVGTRDGFGWGWPPMVGCEQSYLMEARIVAGVCAQGSTG